MIIKLYNGNPNVRDVRRIADILRDGGIVILPTDTLYCFACSMEHILSAETLATIEEFMKKNNAGTAVKKTAKGEKRK